MNIGKYDVAVAGKKNDKIIIEPHPSSAANAAHASSERFQCFEVATFLIIYTSSGTSQH